jgi:Nif-specific ferredoxin III
MSEIITGLTRGGAAWTPEFVVELNQKKCIGCGRCYKVCPRSVFELVEREMDEDYDDEYEDGFDDDMAMVMTISDAMDCIGCGACRRVCPKDCYTHASSAVAA